MLAAAVVHASVADVEVPGADIAPAATGEVPASATPFDLEFVSISRREHIELKLQARSFQSLHTRAVERMMWMQRRHDRELSQAREQVGQLQAELVLARAQIRDLRQRVFGAKAEQSRSINALPAQASSAEQARRPRG